MLWKADMLLVLRYPVVLSTDGGSVIARFRDIPEAITEGTDREEALANAVDCLDAALHFLMKDGKPVPFPSAEKPGEHGVVPTAEISMRVALYQAYRGSGLSIADFSQRIGMNPARVREIVSTYRSFDMRKVAEALRRLGRPVVLSVKAA